jgi:hypothetical protein
MVAAVVENCLEREDNLRLAVLEAAAEVARANIENCSMGGVEVI